MNPTKSGLALVAAILLSGCSTTASAPQSSNLSNQDLGYLTSWYQLIHFTISACNTVQKTTIPDYATAVVQDVCNDAMTYKPALESLAAKYDASLPNALDYTHVAELAALDYSIGYHKSMFSSQTQTPTVPLASYSASYKSEIEQFLSYEVATHQDILADFENEVRSGTNPEIKATAEKHANIVMQNLRRLRAALAEAQRGQAS